MKAKRRHELQTNDLADWLGHALDTIKPYLPTIVIVAVALPVIVFLISYLRTTGNQEGEAAWSAYYSALNTDDDEARQEALKMVGEHYEGNAAGLWALQSAADLKLGEGAQDLFTGKKKDAESKLNQARQGYEKVAADAGEHPLLKRRALYGLAQCWESLMKPEKAREAYQELIAAAPADAAIAKAARRRLATLVDPATAKLNADGSIDWSTAKLRPSITEFYEKFAAYTPPPPSATTGAGEKFDLGQLPEAPDLSFPGSDKISTGDDQSPAGGDFATPDLNPAASSDPAPEPQASDPAPEPQASDPTAPAAEQTTPPAETPASEPAEEQPTEPAAPADEQPAEPTTPPAETPAAEQPAEPASEQPATPETPAEEAAPSEQPEPPASETPAEEQTPSEPSATEPADEGETP